MKNGRRIRIEECIREDDYPLHFTREPSFDKPRENGEVSAILERGGGYNVNRSGVNYKFHVFLSFSFVFLPLKYV